MGQTPVSLSAEQVAELRAARRRRRKIARAITVARVSGWTTAMFAAITLAWGLASSALGSPDWPAIVLGAGMAVIAAGEFFGASRLRCHDARAARLLGCNQLAFGAMLIVYAGWSAVAALGAPIEAELAAVDPEMAAWMGDLTRLVTLAVYGGVALAGLVGPGLAAIYYFTRAAHVHRFAAETPAWVLEALRAAA